MNASERLENVYPEGSALPAEAGFLKYLPQLMEFGRFDGLHEADAVLVFSTLFRRNPGHYLWLCLNNRDAERVAENLRFFLGPGLAEKILVIPGSEADPYRGLSPHPEIAETRAIALWKLMKPLADARGSEIPLQSGDRQGAVSENGFFVVTTLASIATRIPSPANFQSHCIQLEVGNFFPLDHLMNKLREMGYVREDPVNEIGDYSRRGGIVDLYAPSGKNPVRIEFFGDEIESIREFDAATQRSIGLIPSCQIVPMREMVVTEREVALWHERAPECWNEVRFAEALNEKLQFTENGELFNGFEYLFPLVVENERNLLDFLPNAGVVLPRSETFLNELERLWTHLQSNFQEHHSGGDLVLPPEKLFFDQRAIVERLAERKVFYFDELWMDTQPVFHFDFQLERRYQGRIQDLLGDIEKWRGEDEKIVLVMSSRGMAERIVDIFREYELGIYFAESGFDEAYGRPLSVTPGSLSQGFYSPSLKLHVLTEENVFEESRQQVLKKPSQRELARFLSDFRDLKEGDFVVHIDHGIGVFRGLKRVGVGEDEREFVVLEYRDEARLYVPIDRLDLIQKYAGAGEAKPQIDRLGGVSWERTKQRIRKSMRHLAEDLLKLYARREIAKGFTFPPDEVLAREFEDAFEFTETQDQAAAIQAVKSDMESQRPMDRLICGDVGYGKTEVAMRAAFKAVVANKQVAVLTPTTVLAFQHYNTFRERFRAFPVMIEMISRFRTRKEQQDILERIAAGQVDLLIGTHRLLSRDVKFRDLGLIVVDEEQRFGVPQKERLKQLKTSVDVLTLSATPIPRTLNMSMIGLRDLSIIETPPKDRLAIQTVVVRFNKNIIRSAIDLELQRQGQIFFVHNNIETIYSIAQMVQEIVPEARVAVAHGQMGERQLEEVMLQFFGYKYDLLVCTTIIENGLDLPRANTLIVNNAERFGLSQLYQLRGRVGRSNRRAYAFLLIASEETLTTDARQRLAAIKEFSDLGAGFRIAALDLEIRGAGNLLGGEQHGHINAVGFELYMKLLDKSIRELRGEEIPEEVQPSIELRLDIQIPEHYIEDSKLRLWVYKRVSSMDNETELKSLKEEMVDRFGKYPRSVSNLFEYAHLRLRVSRLNILSLERKGQKIFMRFREDTPVSLERLLDVVRRNGHARITPEGVLSFEAPSAVPADVFKSVHEILDEIGVLQ